MELLRPNTFAELVLAHHTKNLIDLPGLLSDTGCSLERVGALVTDTSSTLIDCIAESDGVTIETARRIAYNSFMLLRICEEKIEEAHVCCRIAEEQVFLQQAAAASDAIFRARWNNGVDQHNWEAALNTYRAAAAKVEAAADAASALSQDQAVNDTTVDAATDDATKALEDLLALRSPNPDALLEKLTIIDREGYHNNAMAWASVVDDVRALNGDEEQ